MSDFKIKFRDPQTGKLFEVEADQMKGSWSKGEVDKSFDKSEVGDGKVDLLISEKRWFWDYNRHLGVEKEKLTPEEAAALKRALEDPNSAKLRVFDIMSGREVKGLRVLETDASGELQELSPNLDRTGAHRPVQITPEGWIATPSGENPKNLNEIGDGLFRAASLIDDVKENLFDSIQAPLPLKEKLFKNISETWNKVSPDATPPEGLDEKQILQLRSSAATTALELLTSTENTSEEFQRAAFEQYTSWIEKETNPLLKDSMLFNLHRLSDKLPPDLQTKAKSLTEKLAPTKPPYDKWFADGDNTVDVDFVVGVGDGFLEDSLAFLKKEGFKVVGEQSNGLPILEKTYKTDEGETTFRVKMRYNRRSMFDKVDDPDSELIIYSGHSNWGRNIREALENSPEASGDGKLIMTDLCVGKGEIQMIKDKFPKAHLITTFNSSYFRPGGDAEGFYAMKALFRGIAERKGYREIAEDTRRLNPWTLDHKYEEGIDNNFIFPTDLEIRRKVLDQDHDGQADVFDRMVNFNTFDVKTDTAREFQPIRPARPADQLVGTKIHFAAMSTNRISIYNELLERRNSKAEVVPGGFYQPKPGEKSLFRFKRIDSDTLEMSVNARYSHMSEEALRMASAYEYSMYKASEDNSWPLKSKAENILQALVLAAQSLRTDSGYRDQTVWEEFLKAYNLPEIPLSVVNTARTANDHYYSGSIKSVQYLKENLSPEILSQLEEPDVGKFAGKLD